jgi:anti-sigma28 factor (negative regulator of flagellin synthesis)
MRINKDDNGLPGSTPAKGVKPQGVQPTSEGVLKPSGASASGSDRVSLSNLIDRVSQTLRADSASRTQRVNQVINSVRAGAYQVDGVAVGRALIDHALGAGRGNLG